MSFGHQAVELTCLQLTPRALQAMTPDRRVHWIPISAMLHPDFSDFTEGLVKTFRIADWFCRKAL